MSDIYVSEADLCIEWPAIDVVELPVRTRSTIALGSFRHQAFDPDFRLPSQGVSARRTGVTDMTCISSIPIVLKTRFSASTSNEISKSRRVNAEDALNKIA